VITYDPDILQTYADRLYKRAKWLAGRYGFWGFVGGWAADLAITLLSMFLSRREFFAGAGLWFLPLTFALVGGAYGWDKAFQLRLEAQRTLCQLQIERNTRPPTSPPGGAA